MIQNKLYTVIEGEKDSEGQTIQVKPTEYLLGLKPHEAINELQQYVQSVAEQLEKSSGEDLELPENVDRVRDLVFELEIAQGYLKEVFNAWKTEQGKKAQTPAN